MLWWPVQWLACSQKAACTRVCSSVWAWRRGRVDWNTSAHLAGFILLWIFSFSEVKLCTFCQLMFVFHRIIFHHSCQNSVSHWLHTFTQCELLFWFQLWTLCVLLTVDWTYMERCRCTEGRCCAAAPVWARRSLYCKIKRSVTLQHVGTQHTLTHTQHAVWLMHCKIHWDL